MSRTEKALAVVVAILVLSVVMVAVFAYQEHAAVAAASAYSKAKDEAVAQAQTRIDDRDKVWSDRLGVLMREKARVLSVQDAAAAVKKYVPEAAGPVVEVTRQELPQQVAEQLPTAPSYAVLPKPQFVALGQSSVQCNADWEALGKCKADLDDTRTQLKETGEDRDNWKQTATGGSTAKKVFRVVAYGACAGGGAWLGSKVHSTAGAAVGASGGVLGCALAFK